jgi:two-component system alkaline phosphatase synthesis response regulator PhoP
VTAADGKGALVLFQGEKPDIMILDITLPGLDELEVCREVHQEIQLLVHHF